MSDQQQQAEEGGGCGCFRKKQTYKTSIYNLWGSYEKQPGMRCSIHCKPLESQLISKPPNSQNEVTTVWQVFQSGLKISARRNCLGWRDGDVYKWYSYDDVAHKIAKLAQALATAGLKRQEKVGIYSQTKPDWVITALALTSRSMIIVPLYDTLGAESCTYIINQVEMPMVFVDSQAACKRILSQIKATKCLKTIICFVEPGDELLAQAQENEVKLLTLEKFLAQGQGQSNPAFEDDHPTRNRNQSATSAIDAATPYDLPKPDDIFVIMFTSGTTGDPKGVVHLHSGIVANIVGVDAIFWADYGSGLRFTAQEVGLHYLPLAHAYGLVCVAWFLYKGAATGFFGGNVLKLMEDAAILKPTFVPMVPRLMNRVYSKVVGELEKSKVKSKLFWHAYRKKKEAMLRGVITRSTIWDGLVFKKIQASLGGRVWFMSVGSAPVSNEVLEFCRIVFGALIIEGYGQTECAAVATTAIGPVGGNVGHPIPCNYVKLADVPDCGYYVRDGKGEVCIKGPNVMVHYYKQPDKTAEAIDSDGWLHTGDIGQFLEDNGGALKIIDRKKNIFKLAQGEYIAPEKIENVYAMCPKVLQVFVDGNSIESYTVAVVVPEPTMAAAYASEKGISVLDLPNNKDFVKMILDAMVAVGKENKLNSLEQVKAICVFNEPFTVDNGLLTPTMKNKRPELRKFFKDQIAAMYQAGPMVGEGAAAAAK